MPIILFVTDLTPQQVETLQDSLSAFSESHVVAIQGIVGMIQSAEKVINDKRYKYTKSHIGKTELRHSAQNKNLLFGISIIITEIPDDLESETTGGLSSFYRGNQGLVTGLQNIINLNVATVMNQQDNPMCK